LGATPGTPPIHQATCSDNNYRAGFNGDRRLPCHQFLAPGSPCPANEFRLLDSKGPRLLHPLD
jgi:hypothetical protein